MSSDSESNANMRDHYKVLVDGQRTELRVKGSRFFGQAFAIDSEDHARERLDAIRKQAYDATHHCWGTWFGAPGAEHESFDDDGEPSGTAGAPIARALRADGRHNALVVVTRYFGGTKLGTGGLIRAYGESARKALGAARSRTVWIEMHLKLRIRYEDIGAVEAVLARRAEWIRGVERQFEASPELAVRVLRSFSPELRAQLIEETAGRVQIESDEDA